MPKWHLGPAATAKFNFAPGSAPKCNLGAREGTLSPWQRTFFREQPQKPNGGTPFYANFSAFPLQPDRFGEFRIMPTAVNSLLSERTIRDGYWYYRGDENFPPDVIRQPEEYDGGDCASVVCTQTSLPASQQKKLVERWCEFLPTLHNLRTLWFHSKVPQRLFDAACAIPQLEGLYIKWSGIKDLTPIVNASSLQFFHLGSSTQVASIAPLANNQSLLWLELENIKSMTDLSPIAALRNLVGLAIEGAIWTPQQIPTLAPLKELTELRYLCLFNLKVADKSLQPLHALSKLRTLRYARGWPEAELKALDAALPQLYRPA